MKYSIQEGERYNRLVVLATHQRVEGKRQFYHLCRCDCGNKCYRNSTQLVKGLLKSCGCGYRERLKNGNLIHGEAVRRKGKSFTYLYGLWLRIRSRCYNPNDPYYPKYGGRGITLYPQWRGDYPAFREYVEANLGSRPSLGYRLERFDEKKGYEPGNLLWLTEGEQIALRKGLTAPLFAVKPLAALPRRPSLIG